MKLQRISIAKNASLSYINTNKFKTEALGLSLSIPLTPRDYLCNMLLSGIMRRGTESMPSHAAVNRALDMLYAAVVEISSNTCANTLSLNVGADFLADRHVPEGEDVFGGVIGIIGELLTAPKKQDGAFPADTLRSEIAIVRDALLAERNNTRAYAAMRCRELLHRDNPNYPTLEYLLENVGSGDVVAFDGRVVNAKTASQLEMRLNYQGAVLKYDIDLVNKIWEDRPELLPHEEIYNLDYMYCGKSTTDKLADIRAIFYHELSDNKTQGLAFGEESRGTQALYCKLENYYSVLNKGGVLILDEFDINLHPDILPYLLDWFIKAENNPKHAQILFTTHNTDIMDILGRYRTYLFEKENGESFCYRLDEPKSPSMRNDRPISIPYRKHLIGGFPKIGTKEE